MLGVVSPVLHWKFEKTSVTVSSGDRSQKGSRRYAVVTTMNGKQDGEATGGGNGIDPHELDELLPAVYDDLRRLAVAAMRDERAGHTLQPTALAHEAYLRLAAQQGYRGRTKNSCSRWPAG